MGFSFDEQEDENEKARPLETVEKRA